MAITRGSVFQIKQTKDYMIVRAVNDNGRLCVKSIADDTLSRSYAGIRGRRAVVQTKDPSR